MARRVVWTDHALDELREIAEYVAQQDPQESSRIVTAALAQADERAEFPESGAVVPELDSHSVREIIIKRAFRLIYEVSRDQITVLAVVRARKRLDRKSLRSRRPLE
ncbi:MAG: type II toxin-antitoxin system RelE/ParE family toxin [Planctomycetaceae bacterium]|nr:type II toxin-antitoxin system RelE/ParE family toxin [Planctomycetaceae bacterium]